MKKVLREEDKLIEGVLKEFDLDKDLVILWTDHTMNNVKKTLDLGRIQPRFGEGYYSVLESPMGSFWVKKREKKNEGDFY